MPRKESHALKRSPKKRTAPKNETDDFVSVARRLECDEDKGRFEAKLAKIAKVKPARE
jgi:hypothetical protein